MVDHMQLELLARLKEIDLQEHEISKLEDENSRLQERVQELEAALRKTLEELYWRRKSNYIDKPTMGPVEWEIERVLGDSGLCWAEPAASFIQRC